MGRETMLPFDIYQIHPDLCNYIDIHSILNFLIQYQ